jgi:hypothetical protein
MEEAIDYTVNTNYTNNTEYRETLRNIFRMKPQYYIEDHNIIFENGDIIHRHDIDDETLDEINIDQSRYDICFTNIWELTKDIPIIIELYEWSSAKLMSLDPELGIANLLNYYYLPPFYAILCEIHKGNNITVDMINVVKNAMEYAEYEPY